MWNSVCEKIGVDQTRIEPSIAVQVLPKNAVRHGWGANPHTAALLTWPLLHWLFPPQRCWQNKSFSSLLFPCIRIQNKHFGYDRVFIVTLSSTVRFFPWRGLDFCFEYVSYIAEPSLIDSLWLKPHNLKVHLFLNKNIPFVLYALCTIWQTLIPFGTCFQTSPLWAANLATKEVMLNPRLHRRVGCRATESNVHEMENLTRLGEIGISSSRA
jgi:hypothetical protein